MQLYAVAQLLTCYDYDTALTVVGQPGRRYLQTQSQAIGTDVVVWKVALIHRPPHGGAGYWSVPASAVGKIASVSNFKNWRAQRGKTAPDPVGAELHQALGCTVGVMRLLQVVGEPWQEFGGSIYVVAVVVVVVVVVVA